MEGPDSAIPATLSAAHKGEGDAAARAVESQPDPDGPIWQADAFRRDTWTKVDGEAALPDGPVILPKARWLAEGERLSGRNAPLGLLIAPGDAIDDIAADLPRFALVALSFPKFTDGRGYSLARQLREKHGFAGELRAVGNVLIDQIQLMRRVGFDSFEVTHGPTRRALAESRIPEVNLYYQPIGTDAPPDGTRPWLRRRAD
jgi:phosphoadenosine phosphosulfate reductase